MVFGSRFFLFCLFSNLDSFFVIGRSLMELKFIFGFSSLN